MTSQQLAIELIAQLEGFKSQAYRDTGGIPTIGFGTVTYPNGARVQMEDTCTEAQAKEWLQHWLELHIFPTLDKWDLPDLVYAALASLAYNIGSALHGASILSCVNSQEWGTYDENTEAGTGLAGAFLLYDKQIIDGHLVLSKGLQNRRVAEIKYFLGVLQ